MTVGIFSGAGYCQPRLLGSVMKRQLLVAIDGSPAADIALHQAAVLAQAMDSRLTLVHVVAVGGAGRAAGQLMSRARQESIRQGGRQLLLGRQQQLQARFALDSDIHLAQTLHGKRDMCALVAKFARTTDAHLLVLARHGQGNHQTAPMGSFVEHMLRLAPCPLLIIPFARQPAVFAHG